MGIELDVWPPHLVEALIPRAEFLAATYGAAEGPVQERLAREALELAVASELTVQDSRNLARALLAQALPDRDPGLHGGAEFGPARSPSSGRWPTGAYLRCQWNPLHLVEPEAECMICASASAGGDALREVLGRDLPRGWAGDNQLQAATGRAPLLAGPLVGMKLIKVHESGRAWLVDLHRDGTCTETPMDEGDGDTWTGEWGCDSYGQLVLVFGDYQLAVVGARDGLCPGLEFNAADTDFAETGAFAQSRFVVGVIDVVGDSHRAVKWVGSKHVFRLTRAGGSSWLEEGPLDESALFVGAGWGSSGTWVARRVDASPAGFDLRVESDHGIDYWARVTAPHPGLALWRGTERWRDQRWSNGLAGGMGATLGLMPNAKGEHSAFIAAVRSWPAEVAVV